LVVLIISHSMKIAYFFLPPYFGLFAGFVGHSVRAGLIGAVVGLLLAVLVSREGNRRRGRSDASLLAIDAMTGIEFEDYVAARLRRAGWQVTFTSVIGDYGVDLIAQKDGKSVAIQCKRHGKSVGVAAVQQVVAGARHHGCTKSIVVSNQEFTQAAKQLAFTHGCQLIGRRALQAWVPPPARRAV
jgi:restriction system protein